MKSGLLTADSDSLKLMLMNARFIMKASLCLVSSGVQDVCVNHSDNSFPGLSTWHLPTTSHLWTVHLFMDGRAGMQAVNTQGKNGLNSEKAASLELFPDLQFPFKTHQLMLTWEFQTSAPKWRYQLTSWTFTAPWLQSSLQIRVRGPCHYWDEWP